MITLEAAQAAALNYDCPEGTLKDRIIMVTGAGDGIGRAVSLGLARKGATVILLGRTQGKLESLYDQIVDEGLPTPALVPVNMAQATFRDYEQLAEMLDNEFGRLDGLLHNAGLLGQICPMEQFDPQTWDVVMQVNVNAAFYLTRAMLSLLQASEDASLLFTSSSVGRKGRAFWGAYAVSKFANEGMMQILADELENVSHVRVNSINPGATRTSMRAFAYPAEDPDTLTLPEQLLPAYLYLLGPASQGVNGMALNAQTPR